MENIPDTQCLLANIPKLNYQYSKDEAFVPVIVVTFQFCSQLHEKSKVQITLLCQK